jgi:aryl-alcohol dehydrogenase-like predicted oxidoreductase
MEYRLLGKTGLKVSEIGFGCGNVGGLMVRGSLEERVSAVARALDLGINYFDTAPAYGGGKSEENLGQVIMRIKREVFVATKVALSQEDLKDIKGAVQHSLEVSLRRLNRECVDVLQLHTPVSISDDNSGSAQRVSAQNVLGGLVDAFDGLRGKGMVRFIGFTGLGDTDAIHRIIESGRFDVVQAYYNLLNPSAGMDAPADFAGQNFRLSIGKARANGMGVVVIRVLAGGALGGTAARRGHAAPTVGRALVPGNEYQIDQRRAAKLDFLLRGDIANLSQAGIRFALSNADVSTVLVGFSSLGQIEEAAACSGRGPLPAAAIEQLKKQWAARFSMREEQSV